MVKSHLLENLDESDICLFSDKKLGQELTEGVGTREVRNLEVSESQETENIGAKKQPVNPFLASGPEEVSPVKTEPKNRNPFEEDHDRLNPFVDSNDELSANEEEMLRAEDSSTAPHSSRTDSLEGDRNVSFEDYESVISDIEETLSILSRNSRSTTPASEFGYSSRTSTPNLLNGQFYSMNDLVSVKDRSVSEKHVIPVVTVFDDLKDYLSDSDVSLDYKIAFQRRRQKNCRNLNKQAQLTSLLTTKKVKPQEPQLGFPQVERTTDDKSSVESGRGTDPASISPRPRSFSEGAAHSPALRSGGGARGGQSNGEMDKEPVSKHPQQNDPTVRKTNSSLDLRTRRSPSGTRAASLEPIQEEHNVAMSAQRSRSSGREHEARGRKEERTKLSPMGDLGLGMTTKWPEREDREGSDKAGAELQRSLERSEEESRPQESGTVGRGPVKVCVEKWENLFGTVRAEDMGGSLKRKKELRAASLSNLATSIGSPKSERKFESRGFTSSPAPTFARAFQASTLPSGFCSRLAVNKSVSECNLSQWVGRPSVGNQAGPAKAELDLITSYLGIERRRSASLEPEGGKGSTTEKGPLHS